MAFSLMAQEDAPPATAGRGRGGGRGGRGGGRGGTANLGRGPPGRGGCEKGNHYKQTATCHGEMSRLAGSHWFVPAVLREKGEELGPLIKSGRPQGNVGSGAVAEGTDISQICTCK